MNKKITGSRHKECVRCGKCCMQSSPTLLKSDLSLIQSEKIRFSDIYTIRKGELVNNNIERLPSVTPIELIKIREKNNIGGGCKFFKESDKGCIIYEQKPSQCEALKCWDTDEFFRLLKGPKPERKDIIRDRVLMGMIQEHENRCGYSLVLEYVNRISTEGEKVIEKILDILRFDHQIRPFVCEKLNVHPMETDLFFGRPMTETIKMFGLQVTREPDGTFLLTSKKGS